MTGPLLAIDTATDVASVAVGTPAEVRAVVTMTGARGHAARILPLVDHALREAGSSLDELAGIVVGDGPGSFTGLRIGWAAAKGLAQERGLPLTAVPSLLGAAAAAALRADAGEGAVAACFDALRGQVFGAVYGFGPEQVETFVAPVVLTVAELARVAPVRPSAVVGDGAVRYADEVYVWCGSPPIALEALPPVASSLLALLARPGAGRVLDDPMAAEPAYGRPAEAQAKWEARHGRALANPPR